MPRPKPLSVVYDESLDLARFEGCRTKSPLTIDLDVQPLKVRQERRPEVILFHEPDSQLAQTSSQTRHRRIMTGTYFTRTQNACLSLMCIRRGPTSKARPWQYPIFGSYRPSIG